METQRAAETALDAPTEYRVPSQMDAQKAK